MIRKINGSLYNPFYSSGNNTETSVGTTETVLNSLQLSRATFSSFLRNNDIIGVQTRITKTTFNSTVELRLRLGSTATDISGSQLGIFTSGAASNPYIPFDRKIQITNLVIDPLDPISNTFVTQYDLSYTSDMTYTASSSTPITDYVIDWTRGAGWYLLVTGRSTSSTNTLNCGYIYLDLIQNR